MRVTILNRADDTRRREEAGYAPDFVLLALARSCRSWPFPAQAEGFALSAKVWLPRHQRRGPPIPCVLTGFNAGVGGGAFRYTTARALSDVDYSLPLHLKGGTAALDFHPGGRGLFRTFPGPARPRQRAVRNLYSAAVGPHRNPATCRSQIGSCPVNASYEAARRPFASIGAATGPKASAVLQRRGGVAFTRTPAVTLRTTAPRPLPASKTTSISRSRRQRRPAGARSSIRSCPSHRVQAVASAGAIITAPCKPSTSRTHVRPIGDRARAPREP
jgi:hypothetical protein